MNWKNLFTARSQPTWPESFFFGVATADHQCEAYDPAREDIRDVWERERKLVMRGKATDFENRFAEDVALARRMGCRAFRFSIAWSRVEPAPGQFDDAAFDVYRRLIAAIRGAGMQPILTLHHFTWPLHVEKRGGMIGDGFPALYASYVTEVVKRLGKGVRYWITFNEPSQLVYGYIKPWWQTDYFVPPGLPEKIEEGVDEGVKKTVGNFQAPRPQEPAYPPELLDRIAPPSRTRAFEDLLEATHQGFGQVLDVHRIITYDQGPVTEYCNNVSFY